MSVKEKSGIVVSDKMNKTRTVVLERKYRHPFYGKVLAQKKKLYAHDEKNETKIGDRVRMKETRPLSKLKRWVIVEITERAK